jgi:uncharacterized membrane protein YhaH (DUF805 family)
MLAYILARLGRALWISGRSSRLEWWVIEILVLAGYASTTLASRALRMLGVENGVIGGAILLLLGICLFWLNAASSIRRLHDRNKRGWRAILYIFPILGLAWQFIECGFLPPRNQGNRFDEVAEPDTSGLIVQRARPPSRLIMIVTATLAMGLLASTCMTIRITEVGPHDRLPGDFARDPDER